MKRRISIQSRINRSGSDFKYCLFLHFILLLISCGRNQFEKDTAYPILHTKIVVNGKIAREVYIKSHNDTSDRYILEFFKNGKVCESYYAIDANRNGLYMKYHANGKLAEKGTFIHGKISGLVSLYDEDGKLSAIVEFILFSGSPEGYYANQKYYFNTKGDTLKGTSNYYSLYGKDTIYYGENYELTISIDAPIFPLSGFVICNYDSLFHLNGQSCDTVRMKNHFGVYRTGSYNRGLNVIRGMIYDYEEITDTSGKEFTTGHEFYFKKTFYVK